MLGWTAGLRTLLRRWGAWLRNGLVLLLPACLASVTCSAGINTAAISSKYFWRARRLRTWLRSRLSGTGLWCWLAHARLRCWLAHARLWSGL